MENASKALLIAGGMLLLMLVLSFAILLFRRTAGEASDIYKDLQESDIMEFNQKFLNYEILEDDLKYDEDAKKYTNALTAQDVISIINLARDNNNRGNMPVEVEVFIDGKSKKKEVNSYNGDEYQGFVNRFLSENMDNQYYCIVSFINNSRLVNKIEIKLPKNKV